MMITPRRPAILIICLVLLCKLYVWALMTLSQSMGMIYLLCFRNWLPWHHVLQVLERKCVQCLNEFADGESLLEHMVHSEHIAQFVTERANWDQPE